MIYRIEVRSHPGFNDARSAAIAADIRSLGISAEVAVEMADLFFIEGDLSEADVHRLCRHLLCDPVVQDYAVGNNDRPASTNDGQCVEVAFKLGVTDATADELVRAAHELGINSVTRAATGAQFCLRGDLTVAQAQTIARRLLCNEVIQTFAMNAPIQPLTGFHPATSENARIEIIPIGDADDAALVRLSRERRLSLNLDEMRAIRDYFIATGRDPTDAEIETLAQTWSEHCVHKTFKALIQIADSSSATCNLQPLMACSKPTSSARPTRSLRRG